jgi:hypothetical protein
MTHFPKLAEALHQQAAKITKRGVSLGKRNAKRQSDAEDLP